MNKEYPKVVLIEGVVMANGEFVHYGKSLGYMNKEQQRRLEAGAGKLARGGEAIIALGEETA